MPEIPRKIYEIVRNIDNNKKQGELLFLTHKNNDIQSTLFPLLNFSVTTIIEIPLNEEDEDFEPNSFYFPDGIKRINDYAYANNSSITQINIPS